jgi:hypothetical protein
VLYNKKNKLEEQKIVESKELNTSMYITQRAL